MMTRVVWTLLGLLWALPGVAQDTLKPEVMLMIDGSHRMGQPLDFRLPDCADRSQRSAPVGWVNQTPDTPLNMVKEALLGTVKAPEGVRWCIEEDAQRRLDFHDLGDDGPHPHLRQMCCDQMQGDRCAAWLPCYADNGQLDDPDAVALDNRLARSQDGMLERNAQDIKFGLMYSDGHPSPLTSALGHYSYGDDNLRAAGNQIVNMGARASAPPGRLHVGALVDPDRGMLSPGNGNVNNGRVGDSASKVGRHTQFVQYMVSRLVPHGASVIAPLLHDAGEFFGPANECRSRLAVLITRGHEDDRGPYQSAADYARQLLNKGVAVHVILIATGAEPGQEGWAQQIASAGGGTFARAESAAGVRKALQDIINRERTGTLARGRSLILASSTADCENQPCRPDRDAVQWRINAFAEVVEGTAYGRIHAQQLICPGQNGGNGVPVPKAQALAYEAVLADRTALPRRAVAKRPPQMGAGAGEIALTGAPGAGFGDHGENQMGNDQILADLFGVDLNGLAESVNGGPVDQNGPDIPANPSIGRAGGMRINGFFGPRGLGADARRQLGATISGDIVALRPPALGLTDPAYLRFRDAMQARPTLIATGARDGLIHVFQAKSGIEVINFMPSSSWSSIAHGDAPVDGPLTVADVVPCRPLENGAPANCPAELTPESFESWMFGSAGSAAANIFGVRLREALDLAVNPNRALAVDRDVGAGGIWDLTDIEVTTAINNANGFPGLTLAPGTPRPAVTHVRERDAIRAALIVGCGQGPDVVSAGPGRCVMVLEASTGRLIKVFHPDNSDDLADLLADPSGISSFSSSPVAFPAEGIAPANRAYIGDARGRIWRLDLRDADPSRWRMDIAWPPTDANLDIGGYELGRAVVGRPSVALRPDGAVVVSFITDRTGEGQTDRAYAISFTDKTTIDENGGVSYRVTPNWYIPLRSDEYGTGEPVVRDEVLYFTTRRDVPNGNCGQLIGRVYGVDYYRPYINADGNPDTYNTEAGAAANARPAIQLNDNGAVNGRDGLSIILPPGRVSYGLSIARTPTCTPEQPATTTMVLNVAETPDGGAAPLANAANDSQVEVVRAGGTIEPIELRGTIFMQGQGKALEMCLDCTADGAPAQGDIGQLSQLPFPSQVVYWGSTFLN